MEKELNDLFRKLLEQHISNPSAKAAMSLIENDEDYKTDHTPLETELAIKVYERRISTSTLPKKEIEELKRIVDELKLLDSYEISIVTVIVKQWSTKRAPAYMFFLTSSFDRLIGVIQSESPGKYF